MTVTEVKTTLSVCPPDDDTNPDVPGLYEAIQFAKRNPPLLAWWEKEKNFDRNFSRKLGSVLPPPELAPSIMRGGATIFFASRMIAESMGENPDDDSTLPEVIPAEPILPKSTFTRDILKPMPKETNMPAFRTWRWTALVIAMLIIAVGALFAALWLLPLLSSPAAR